MTISRAESRVRMWRFSDVSGTQSPSSRCVNMGTELVLETSENRHILTRLSAREIFIDAHQMLAYLLHVGYLLASDELFCACKDNSQSFRTVCFSFSTSGCSFSISCPFTGTGRGGGINTHANWSKDGRRHSQCKSLRLVELSRWYDCPTQNCLYFAWFQLTLSGVSCLIASELVTALLRVTASVWNVLQSATLAAIITPPQRQPPDWKVYAVTISCVFAHYDEVRSKPLSCRN